MSLRGALSVISTHIVTAPPCTVKLTNYVTVSVQLNAEPSDSKKYIIIPDPEEEGDEDSDVEINDDARPDTGEEETPDGDGTTTGGTTGGEDPDSNTTNGTTGEGTTNGDEATNGSSGTTPQS